MAEYYNRFVAQEEEEEESEEEEEYRIGKRKNAFSSSSQSKIKMGRQEIQLQPHLQQPPQEQLIISDFM